MEKESSNRLNLLKKYLDDSPEDPFLLFAVAKEYEKLNDTENALIYYLKVNSSNPDYVGNYYHLGKLYEQTGQLSKAFETYKEGMSIAQKTSDQHAFEELAGAKLALGDDEDFE